MSVVGTLHIGHEGSLARENIDDHRLLVFPRVHVAMHQATRDMEEVSWIEFRCQPSLRAVLQSESAEDQEAVEVPLPVVMPGRRRSSRDPGSGDRESSPLERRVANNSLCRLSRPKMNAPDDIDLRHGRRDRAN